MNVFNLDPAVERATEWAQRADGLGVCAAEGVEAKRVGKEPNVRPLLRTVAEATAGKTAATWDISPRVAADALVPRRRLGANPRDTRRYREDLQQRPVARCVCYVVRSALTLWATGEKPQRFETIRFLQKHKRSTAGSRFKRALMKSWCAGLLALGFVAAAMAQSAAPSTTQERGFIWEARKGTQRVLLVGTRHVGRPETAALPDALLKHFAEAKVLALEADTSNAQAAAEAAQRYALYGVGEALLNERIDVRMRTRLEAVLPRYGMNPAVVWRMKPWFVAMNLVVAELRRTGFSSAYGTEAQLLALAAAQDKRVVEIESMELQLKLFENALATQQIAFLEQTLASLENDEAQKEVKTLMDAWSKGDAAAMEDLLAQMHSKAIKNVGDRFVVEQILEGRHPRMLDAIERYGASGSLHLVAVGCLHYFGPKGLMSGLRERGWTVTVANY